MGLFQKSVLNKYLKEANDTEMQLAYQKLVAYFHNPVIQQNIRDSKEEQFQEGFLTELFAKVLGYTINPNPNYNLTTEFKNERGAKKADGAILSVSDQHRDTNKGLQPLVNAHLPHSLEAIGVIELKSTTTKDLESIRLQAFDYKANQSKCAYVVTSNFEKLRFYIQNAVDFEEFDLFKITYEQFRLLWLCLAKTNLMSGVPLAMKEASLLKEDDITKQFYVDYSAFKRDLYNDLVANNLNLEIFCENDEKESKLLLFKKSQKLLDRFLFVFFGEDRGLLPPNSISEIIGQWAYQSDWGDDVRLYSRFQKYFALLNTGWKGKKYEIFAYNGGLFAPDKILDSIEISDEILKKHTKILTGYDFETDVDVNILGHIFENSLNEIEEITAQIEAEERHRNSSKNKGLQSIVDSKEVAENKGLQPLVQKESQGQAVSNKGLQPLVQKNPLLVQQPLVQKNPPLVQEPLAQENTPLASIEKLNVSKRKRDGVFYTPKYITKYIVENTVGNLCNEKRSELGIDENEYLKTRKGRTTKKLKELDDKLTDYRNWLLALTICDPACGSGAFLNQALDFLIREHRYIDELRAQLLDVPMIFTEVENSILENNIYGVDINDESVEIAKLSLWLRTAQKGRKLTSLNNNIKCGNSLIDDPGLAGEKAFNWQTEFPQVFRKKEKTAWHVTFVTHDTRTSARMIKYKVRERKVNGEMYVDRSIYLDEKDALKVTEIIAEIVLDEKINCMAYNIATDHVHMILVCEAEELLNIMRKLKGKSAQKFKEYLGLRKEETFNLWAQKFNRKLIHSEEQFQNTLEYILNNRDKHFDSDDKQGVATPCSEDRERFNKGLQPLVQKMTCTRQYAFRTEYSGGFDVVIGNPPYVQLQTMGEMSNSLSKSAYQTYNKSADLYCLFYERGCQILKPKGFLSYITSNKWLRVNYGESLRKFLTTKVNPTILIDFPGISVFADAVVDPHILILTNEPYQGKTEACAIKTNTADIETVFELNKTTCKFSAESWTIMLPDEARKLEQIKLNGTELKDLPISINYGIKTGYNEAFYIDEVTRQKLIDSDPKSAELIKPMLRGRDISPYGISGSEYLINVHNGLKEINPTLKPIKINEYPAIKTHLDAFYPALEKRGDKGETPYNLRNCAYLEEFSKPKIMYPNMTSVFPFMYDESGFLSNDKSFIFTANDDSISLLFLTAVFNSSLAKLWIWYNCPELGDNRREIRKVYFEHFPVPQANTEQQSALAQLAKERTLMTSDFQTLTTKFERSIQRKFNIEKLTTKMQNWYLLSYAGFIKELNKQKVKLSLSEEAEWEDYFNEQKQKAQTLKSEIAETDKNIDVLVAGLYGVEQEEVGIKND
jgi:REP element-mobilizing transposase RayT